MSQITQVCLCGFGGQGIILAGLLLGQAGVIDGRYVSGSSSYGARQGVLNASRRSSFLIIPLTTPI